MTAGDIKFCENIVKCYLGDCYVSSSMVNNVNDYQQSNVKFHTQDFNWLRAFVLNRVYSDFKNQHEALCVIHEYLVSPEFAKLMKSYQKRLIDTYTKKVLSNINVNNLLKVHHAKRVETVCKSVTDYISKVLYIDKQTILARLAENKEKITNIIEQMLTGNKHVQAMIEKL